MENNALSKYDRTDIHIIYQLTEEIAIGYIKGGSYFYYNKGKDILHEFDSCENITREYTYMYVTGERGHAIIDLYNPPSKLSWYCDIVCTDDNHMLFLHDGCKGGMMVELPSHRIISRVEDDNLLMVRVFRYENYHPSYPVQRSEILFIDTTLKKAYNFYGESYPEFEDYKEIRGVKRDKDRYSVKSELKIKTKEDVLYLLEKGCAADYDTITSIPTLEENPIVVERESIYGGIEKIYRKDIYDKEGVLEDIEYHIGNVEDFKYVGKYSLKRLIPKIDFSKINKESIQENFYTYYLELDMVYNGYKTKVLIDNIKEREEGLVVPLASKKVDGRWFTDKNELIYLHEEGVEIIEVKFNTKGKNIVEWGGGVRYLEDNERMPYGNWLITPNTRDVQMKGVSVKYIPWGEYY